MGGDRATEDYTLAMMRELAVGTSKDDLDTIELELDEDELELYERSAKRAKTRSMQRMPSSPTSFSGAPSRSPPEPRKLVTRRSTDLRASLSDTPSVTSSGTTEPQSRHAERRACLDSRSLSTDGIPHVAFSETYLSKFAGQGRLLKQGWLIKRACGANSTKGLGL